MLLCRVPSFLEEDDSIFTVGVIVLILTADARYVVTDDDADVTRVMTFFLN